MKKEHVLPNGRVLRFPPNTPDEVVQATIKRISNTKQDVNWTTDQVRAVVSEITAKNAEAVLDKNKVDNFGPAIEKLGSTIIKSTEEIISQTKKTNEKTNQEFLKSFETSMRQTVKEVLTAAPNYSKNIDQITANLSKQVATVAVKIEMSSHALNKSLFALTGAVDKNTQMLAKLLDAQVENTKAVSEMVKTLSAKKIINRDKSGNIVSVDTQ